MVLRGIWVRGIRHFFQRGGEGDEGRAAKSISLNQRLHASSLIAWLENMSESINLSTQLEEQKQYYKARAPEYDEWFYRIGSRYDLGEDGKKRWFEEVDLVCSELNKLGPVENAVEFAAGTGNFTKEIVKIVGFRRLRGLRGQLLLKLRTLSNPQATNLLVLDASPETLQINKSKIPAPALPKITYQIADLFSWKPTQQYDLLFAGFWLSHVPPELLDSHLSTISSALKKGGKLMFVDSLKEAGKASANDEVENSHPDHYHVRTLNSGDSFTIVKVFYGKDLEVKLGEVGIRGEWKSSGGYFWYFVGTKV